MGEKFFDIINRSVAFDAPQFLLLLAVLPLFWWIGRRSLHALGRSRRRVALALRLGVAALLVVALAEPNWLQVVDRLSVLFVVDGSDSIAREELDQALDYVNAAVDQRDALRGDQTGLVVFGRDAEIEVPAIDATWRVQRIESRLDPQFTNLAGALQVAGAAFPPDSAKRVVVVSDGNQNIGQAMPQARELLGKGVGIDVVPISYSRSGDVAVEKLSAPTAVRAGAPFALRVVLNNLHREQPVAGTLRVTLDRNAGTRTVVEQPVTVAPGKQVLTLRQELPEGGFATYEANFVADSPAEDAFGENNRSTAFSQVAGPGRLLVIEDATQPGRFAPLVEMLQADDIEVEVRDTRRPFDNLADLQQFDAVWLADVARVSGEGADEITQLTNDQIEMLVQNTEHFGAGLVVLGGPNSYGAGGWNNTQLEEAMPVDFQIDNARVDAVGALVLVIDSSGSMAGEKIAWSKAAAVAASEMLGRRDYIGVAAFDTAARWIVPVNRQGEGRQVRARIERLGAGGGTDMMPAQAQAYRAIGQTSASAKHVIVLTDGQTPPNDYVRLARQMQDAGITTSAVAVGPDADRRLLANIAQAGNGKFYFLQSPDTIPRIFMREARRVAMPLVFEDDSGFSAQVVTSGEVLTGIEGALPPLTGYVMTTVKDNPLVEVAIATPRQPAPNSTILATWPYGAGRTAALTTDVGQRWATAWSAWPGYEKLFTQLARWSMSGRGTNDALALATEVRDGAIDVVVTALDQDDTRLNYLTLRGVAIGPDREPQEFPLQQTAPGRYVASLPAEAAGNYYLAIHGGGDLPPLRTAVHLPRTAEFARLESNEALLAQIAEGAPPNGQPGAVIAPPGGVADLPGLLETDVFRPGVPPAIHRDSIWPWLLLVASVLFLGDVACRRLMISLAWLAALIGRRRPSAEAPVDTPLQRLKRTKADVSETLVARQRYEATEATDSPAAVAQAADRPPASAAPAPADAAAPEPPASGSTYTSRLLAAKRRERQRRQPPS